LNDLAWSVQNLQISRLDSCLKGSVISTGYASLATAVAAKTLTNVTENGEFFVNSQGATVRRKKAKNLCDTANILD
tara:strand:- start:13798 stop:14025 length:228 start_codon:yes stop_codon:yes gene_type:complete